MKLNGSGITEFRNTTLREPPLPYAVQIQPHCITLLLVVEDRSHECPLVSEAAAASARIVAA